MQGTLLATDVHAGRLQKLAQAAAAQGLSNVQTQAVDLCDLAVSSPTSLSALTVNSAPIGAPTSQGRKALTPCLAWELPRMWRERLLAGLGRIMSHRIWDAGLDPASGCMQADSAS